MKAFAIPITALALLAATAGAARAHVDGVGQPDPYWQQIAAASAGGAAQVSAAGQASIDPPAFEVFTYASGGLSLLLTLSLLRSLWTGEV